VGPLRLGRKEVVGQEAAEAVVSSKLATQNLKGR
jgi:hypothetical protein